MAERSSGPSQTPLLPLSIKDGKSKSKEDHHINENNVAEEHISFLQLCNLGSKQKFFKLNRKLPAFFVIVQ